MSKDLENWGLNIPSRGDVRKSLDELSRVIDKGSVQTRISKHAGGGMQVSGNPSVSERLPHDLRRRLYKEECQFYLAMREARPEEAPILAMERAIAILNMVIALEDAGVKLEAR